ncbi:Uma2 family endonuclease [Thiobaca trueperi]|uniref:Putative restriction endonuclease n=1 Tax=Thiobaca trueperi TaxID=127458 RepID=A0A4R3N348_9GAMM|nr:Uma2 family endonuclease [Thiobaca trueperi]TCT21493.1 putative restriction endonuclease [Thiobaca trueperi]
MSLQPQPYYSFEDYLAAERECIDEKHEYVAGQVFAMTGASYNHNVISANLARKLGNQLESRPCVALSSDMRLRIEIAEPAPIRMSWCSAMNRPFMTGAGMC